MPMDNVKFFPYLQFSYSLNYNISPYVYNKLIISKNPIKELKNSYLIFINTQKDTNNKYNENNNDHNINGNGRKKKLKFLLLTTKKIYDDHDEHMSITPHDVEITKYVNKVSDEIYNNIHAEDVIELAYNKGDQKKKKLNEQDNSYRKIFQFFEINILQNVKNNIGFVMFKTFEDFKEEIFLFLFSNTSANFITVQTNGSIYMWNFKKYLSDLNKYKKKT